MFAKWGTVQYCRVLVLNRNLFGGQPSGGCLLLPIRVSYHMVPKRIKNLCTRYARSAHEALGPCCSWWRPSFFLAGGSSCCWRVASAWMIIAVCGTLQRQRVRHKGHRECPVAWGGGNKDEKVSTAPCKAKCFSINAQLATLYTQLTARSLCS